MRRVPPVASTALQSDTPPPVDVVLSVTGNGSATETGATRSQATPAGASVDGLDTILSPSPSTAPVYRFRWYGTSARGATQGEMRGPSVAWVRASLRRQGIRDARVHRAWFASRAPRAVATMQELSMFSRQLATMLGAGIPMATAMDTLLLHCPRAAMKSMLSQVRDEIEAGSTLGAALATHPHTFSPLYLGLVRSGELAGALEQTLVQLATHLEKTIAIQKKIRTAMLYPSVVAAVAISVTALMMGFVIPRFEVMFQNYGAALPPLTRIVLSCSEALRAFGVHALVLIVGGIFAMVTMHKQSARLRYMQDRMILCMPLFGALVHKAVTARIAHTLAMMLQVGAPLLEALPPLAAVAGNGVYQRALLQAAQHLGSGRSLAASLKATGVFPPMLLQMVKSGEECGKLDAMLREAGNLLEAELDNSVAALGALLEPLIIALLGILIGIIVVAMYLPVFRIASVF